MALCFSALQTVKPIRGGGCGVAGGEKYLVAGMYIKFLIDHKGLYGSEGASRINVLKIKL
jgi:hypothetical protein